jgi:hypothetical protein
MQLEDMLTRQRMDYGSMLSGQELGNRPRLLEAIERRTDAGPAYQDVAGVSGAVGQSQANVPDYLSALGGQGTATSSGGGGGGGTGITPGGRLDANINTKYRTPSTRYSITSRGGSGVANPLSLQGSRQSSGSRTGRSGGFGGSGGGAGGSSGGGFGDGFGGGRSGPETLQQTGGGGSGQGSGQAVTIIVNEDGSYYDATNGQSYGSMEELQESRRTRQDNRGQDPMGSGGEPTPADPNTRPPDGTEPQPEGEEQSVLSQDNILGPDGQSINVPIKQEGENWYLGMPPIYWSYFYGNVPGIGIMQGQEIATKIAARIRERGNA